MNFTSSSSVLDSTPGILERRQACLSSPYLWPQSRAYHLEKLRKCVCGKVSSAIYCNLCPSNLILGSQSVPHLEAASPTWSCWCSMLNFSTLDRQKVTRERDCFQFMNFQRKQIYQIYLEHMWGKGQALGKHWSRRIDPPVFITSLRRKHCLWVFWKEYSDRKWKIFRMNAWVFV